VNDAARRALPLVAVVRRTLPWVAVAAIAAIAIVKQPITRGPSFHHYADTRTWLGIPHAGDVLSNAGFLIAALWAARRLRDPLGRLACAGVFAIGIGSAAYHAAPCDTTLALDWAPIAITLSLIVTAVIADRVGARAAVRAAAVGPLLAGTSVAYWWGSGGTAGGDMTPYVAVQAAGVVLPPLVAISRPGQIATPWLCAAVGGFAAARAFAAHDAELLATLGISGHSLKHLAAAVAAAIALHALCDRETRRG
jgi:hypothetical protein